MSNSAVEARLRVIDNQCFDDIVYSMYLAHHGHRADAVEKYTTTMKVFVDALRNDDEVRAVDIHRSGEQGVSRRWQAAPLCKFLVGVYDVSEDVAPIRQRIQLYFGSDVCAATASLAWLASTVADAQASGNLTSVATPPHHSMRRTMNYAVYLVRGHERSGNQDLIKLVSAMLRWKCPILTLGSATIERSERSPLPSSEHMKYVDTLLEQDWCARLADALLTRDDVSVSTRASARLVVAVDQLERSGVAGARRAACVRQARAELRRQQQDDEDTRDLAELMSLAPIASLGLRRRLDDDQ